jgi:hypothetical protein
LTLDGQLHRRYQARINNPGSLRIAKECGSEKPSEVMRSAMKVAKNHWGLLVAPFILGACGLVKVNINGETKTLAELTSSEENKTAENKAEEKGSSSGSGSAGGSGSSSKPKDAAKSAKEDQDKLRDDTRNLMAEMDKTLIEGPDAIPAAKITAMSEKQTAFEEAGLQNEALYVAHLLTYYKLENAWRGDAANTGDALAKQLKGAVTTQGELSGKDKPVSFKFQAEAGKCYTVISHMKMAGGDDDGASDFFLDGGAKGSKLQRYDIPARRTRGPGLLRRLAKSYTEGACALESMEVTVSLTMKYAGTANGLRYVVIEHARDKFPKYLAVDLQPSLSDTCDVEGWTNLWTNPLPGAVVYGSTEPFLTHDAGTADELWMTAWTAGFQEARLRRGDVVSTPPKQFKFDDKPKYRKCSRELKYAHSPEGLKVAQCFAALDKRFDPQFDSAQRAKDQATTLLGEINAQKRLDSLNAQYDEEVDRTCAKQEADINKKFEDAYNKIVDFYMTNAPKPYFDRAAEMKAQHEGVNEIR